MLCRGGPTSSFAIACRMCSGSMQTGSSSSYGSAPCSPFDDRCKARAGWPQHAALSLLGVGVEARDSPQGPLRLSPQAI